MTRSGVSICILRHCKYITCITYITARQTNYPYALTTLVRPSAAPRRPSATKSSPASPSPFAAAVEAQGVVRISVTSLSARPPQWHRACVLNSQYPSSSLQSLATLRRSSGAARDVTWFASSQAPGPLRAAYPPRSSTR